MTQLQRFKKALESSRFDGAIISSELNQRYLCDFPFSDGYILITQDKSYILTDFRYEEAIKKAVSDFLILCPEKSMADTIAELFSENQTHNVAVEESEISLKKFELFKEKLKDIATLTSGASDILLSQRAIKLDYEIERIKKAQAITDLAFSYIVDFISANKNTLTEKDIALELDYFMQKHGAESTAFETIAVSGDASSLPHGVPRNEKLKNGFLTMDFGAKYNGYCSDMTRTIVIGKADEEIKKIYDTVLTAQKTALEQIHGGMPCRTADAIARKIITDAGYGKAFGHSLGHGVGMFIHEKPTLSPRALPFSLLEAGNVVTVEPGIYLEGRFGC
ncbi:MAG: aminopeptidase P family protein, partial [Clostridia bacterium]|nr:aminopeptidase P family protein [Clostridia bacterium]